MDTITTAEAGGRLTAAVASFILWPTDDLWSEFGLLTDDAWDGRTTEDGPDPDLWARREGIGLALIGRGATAADLARGFPLN